MGNLSVEIAEKSVTGAAPADAAPQDFARESPSANDVDTDDLLAQMAGQEIERLLAEAQIERDGGAPTDDRTMPEWPAPAVKNATPAKESVKGEPKSANATDHDTALAAQIDAAFNDIVGEVPLSKKEKRQRAEAKLKEATAWASQPDPKPKARAAVNVMAGPNEGSAAAAAKKMPSPETPLVPASEIASPGISMGEADADVDAAAPKPADLLAAFDALEAADASGDRMPLESQAIAGPAAANQTNALPAPAPSAPLTTARELPDNAEKSALDALFSELTSADAQSSPTAPSSFEASSAPVDSSANADAMTEAGRRNLLAEESPPSAADEVAAELAESSASAMAKEVVSDPTRLPSPPEAPAAAALPATPAGPARIVIPAIQGEPRPPLMLRLLELLNAPLNAFGDAARQLIGKVAIVTLLNAVLILAYVLFVRKA